MTEHVAGGQEELVSACLRAESLLYVRGNARGRGVKCGIVQTAEDEAEASADLSFGICTATFELLWIV